MMKMEMKGERWWKRKKERIREKGKEKLLM